MLEGTEEKHKNLSQGNWSLSQDLHDDDDDDNDNTP
jgi:hypothetical protein